MLQLADAKQLKAPSIARDDLSSPQGAVTGWLLYSTWQLAALQVLCALSVRQMDPPSPPSWPGGISFSVCVYAARPSMESCRSCN